MFIWKVFLDFARAVNDLAQEPPKDSIAKRISAADHSSSADEWYTIHFDIKPKNAFLDYGPDTSAANSPASHYPVTRLGDFTLAEYTYDEDVKNNPVRMWVCGTKQYKAHEQIGYSAHWENPATGFEQRFNPNTGELFLTQDQAHQQQRDEINDAAIMNDTSLDIFFTHQLNVWGIGKIIYELITLDEKEGLGTKYPTTDPRPQEATGNEGLNPVFPFDGMDASRFYSAGLLSLVRKCLHPDPQFRPPSERLKDFVQIGLETCEEVTL